MEGLGAALSTVEQIPTVGALDDLLGGLSIRTLPGGRLSIEAPPPAASALATMLRVVATMLETGGG